MTPRSAIADARAGFPSRKGGARRVAARAKLARLLWNADGSRRVPSNRSLDAALSANTVDDLEWLFEFNPLGPLYFLPTREWLKALAQWIGTLGVKRVLEVGAGDGALSRALAPLIPGVRVVASDSGAWSRPTARMNTTERRAHRGLPVAGLALGPDVLRFDAKRAIAKENPELVICAWAPPGPLLEQVIRAPVRFVLDVGAPGGVTASQWTWRFAHDFLEGPLESLGRCRLDVRPAKARHTRVTLYFGGSHADFDVERVKQGDWLWQFRPQ